MTSIGFDRAAIGIDPEPARCQMDANLAVAVKCLVMDQNFGLVRTIEEKSLGKWRSVVWQSGFGTQDRDAALGTCGAQSFCGRGARQSAAEQQEINEGYFV
jgi:hypothetical protein